MNQYIILSLLIVTIAGVAYLVWSRLFSEALLRRANAVTRKLLGSDGLTMYWENEVDTFNSQSEDAIASGLRDTFYRALCAGYSKKLNLSDYTIVILNPDAQSSDGMPALKIKIGSAYKGSEFDQGDGTMLIAGQAVDPKRCVIAVPEHSLEQMGHLERVIRHEATHCLRFWNDRESYERTKLHLTDERFELPECT